MAYESPFFGANPRGAQIRVGSPGAPTAAPPPPAPTSVQVPPDALPAKPPVQPGLKAPTPAQGDLELNKKLQGETYFDIHKDEFTKPGLAEEVAKKAMAEGHAPVTQNTQEAFGMWKNQVPADMSSYYANAGRQAIEGINRTTAARGIYGSSAANDLTSEALTNLAADRAKAEAGYGLQRMGLGVQAASAADNSSLGASANERGWLNTVGGLAQGADTGRLSGLIAGTNAAGNAERAYLDRVKTLFGSEMDFAGGTSGVIGEGNRAIQNRDADLVSSRITAGVAPYSEGAAGAIRLADQSRSDQESTQRNAAALAKLFDDQRKAKTRYKGTEVG